MSKLYLISEKGVSINYKKDIMELSEIIKIFKPSEEFEEDFEAWEAASNECTFESVQYFIDNYVNNNDGMHYHDYVIEEWI